MQQVAEDAARRLDAQDRLDQERFQAMERALDGQENRENMQNAVEAHMTQRIESLEQGIAEIKRRNTCVNDQLTVRERDNYQLQVSIEELKVSMRKKEKSWVGQFFTAVAVTGVCILATYAFGGPTIFPFEKGAGVGIKFAI